MIFAKHLTALFTKLLLAKLNSMTYIVGPCTFYLITSKIGNKGENELLMVILKKSSLMSHCSLILIYVTCFMTLKILIWLVMLMIIHHTLPLQRYMMPS